MPESFDAFRYIGYLRRRLRWIAGVCAATVALALAISLMLPREYTATARLVIEPPSGGDLRMTAVAVSPIYLESLKTYEHFAASDSLFAKALEQSGVRRTLAAKPIESLKRHILKVGIVRNTRILEISATLPDPARAQALAQFLAESTVTLNRTTSSNEDREVIQGIERQRGEIQSQLEQVEATWSKTVASEPVEELQSALEAAAALRAKVEEQVLSSELEIADAEARAREGPESEAARFRGEAANSRARLAQMHRQLATIDHRSAATEKLLGQRMARRDRLEADRKAAQTLLAAVEGRLRDAQGAEGLRSERLRIIDPGIVPERPSSPNLPLNIAAALLLGLVLPVLYFTLEMGYRAQRPGDRVPFQAYAKARHE